MSERIDREAVAWAWYRIVGSGDLKQLQAGTRIELVLTIAARGGYVMKFAAKIEQKRYLLSFRTSVGSGELGVTRPSAAKSRCIAGREVSDLHDSKCL
jgi:hypothetical protein